MKNKINEIGKDVVDLQIRALKKLKNSIDESFDDAVKAILKCKSKVIICGVGKSGIIASKISATLSSVGTPSFSISASDYSHGDLGRISNKDMRKIRVFEKNCYSNIDLLNKQLTKHYANYNDTDNKLNFKKEELDMAIHDALQMELIHFCNTIKHKKIDLDNITKAVDALQIAEQINEIINKKLNA